LKDNVAEEVEKPQTAVASEATIVALQEQTEEPHLLEFSDDEEDDSSAISIKMTWIRNAVAVAAAVVAFFFIATPVANSDLGTPTMSQLQHSILYKLIPQDTTLPTMEPVAEAPVAEKVVEEAPAAEKVVAEKIVAEKPAVTYCIIVASQVKESNAELYVEKLKKNGYPNAYVYISNHVVRVVSDEFASQAEAYRVLNKMNMNEEFYEAWVYKKVNG
jgi:cell division septation protein DedD